MTSVLSRYPKILNIIIGAEEQYLENDMQSPEHFFREWMVYESGIYLNPGANYGEGGAGHMRMNLAS